MFFKSTAKIGKLDYIGTTYPVRWWSKIWMRSQNKPNCKGMLWQLVSLLKEQC